MSTLSNLWKEYRWWIISAIICIFLGARFFGTATPDTDEKETPTETQNNSKPRAEVITFGQWTPQGARQINGLVQSQAETTIRAELNGKIDRVLVDIGSEVRQGQILARYDVQGDTTYVNYQSAVNSLEATKSSTDASVTSARLALENAKKEYQQLQNQEEQNKIQTLQGLLNTIQSTRTTGLNVLNFFDGQLGASPQYEDLYSAGRTLVGQNNRILKNQAKNQARELRLTYEQLPPLRNIVPDQAALLSEARTQLGFLQQLRTLGSQYNQLIEGTVTSANFSVTLKSQITAQTDGNNAQLDQILSALSSQIQAVESFAQGQANRLLAAQNRIKSSQAALELAESQAQAQVKNAQNGVNLAATQTADLRVIAPFSGVITQKFIQDRTQVNLGQELFSIYNPQAEKIVRTSLAPEEISRISGQESIKINSQGKTFFSETFRVSQTLNQSNQKAQVDFVLPREEDLPPSGSEATVQLSDEGPSDLLPLSALSFEPDGSAQVLTVSADGTLVSQSVQVQQVLSGGIKILQGLEPQTPIIRYKNRFYNGQIIEVDA
jgi:multidrug resistance efflux pump